MSNHIIVYLSREDRKLLRTLSMEDIRPLDNQIRFLIRNEAARRGILAPTKNQITANVSQAHGDLVCVNP